MQRVSIVDVKVPKDLKIGYIMGAGDEIPTVLQQIGMNVSLIPAEKVVTEDLSKYQTIVLVFGLMTLRKDVIANNKRAARVVEEAEDSWCSTTLRQAISMAGSLAPYPLTLSRARVSVEEAPVKILDPATGSFILQMKSRRRILRMGAGTGLYFASQWESEVYAVAGDARSGRGRAEGWAARGAVRQECTFTRGLAFFRQLPAGVPGAVRLFVNLVSAE